MKDFIKGSGTKIGLRPEGAFYLKSGGDLNVTGTVYFPTQSVEVNGKSHISAQSYAASFIAYQLKFTGQVEARLKVDHKSTGLPPIIPRSDEGVRLVR